jgi:hypothetical protein
MKEQNGRPTRVGVDKDVAVLGADRQHAVKAGRRRAERRVKAGAMDGRWLALIVLTAARASMGSSSSRSPRWRRCWSRASS